MNAAPERGRVLFGCRREGVEMGPSQQTAVTAATQEVRFATVWTGGVSLAIWMGGVARELNLLDQAGRQREARADRPDASSCRRPTEQVRSRYLALLDLLDVVVRIDVLSGTSAGGINAALLGTCHATGWDLGWLRDVWLTAGDLGLLLRDPASKDPPSLLRGDGVLLAQLDENLKRPTPMVEEARPTTVHITTTLLEGETSRFTDSYGTLVPDVNHLGAVPVHDTGPARRDRQARVGARRTVERQLSGRLRAGLPPVRPGRQGGGQRPRAERAASRGALPQHHPLALGGRRRHPRQPADPADPGLDLRAARPGPPGAPRPAVRRAGCRRHAASRGRSGARRLRSTSR